MKLRFSLFLLSLAAVLMFAGCDKKEEAPAFNYITAEEVSEIIAKNDPGYVILDIQVQEDFDKHHLKNAVATCAYPVKTDDEKARLKKYADEVKADQKIIIICPRGKGGAENSVNYLRETGIDNSRLLILKDGQQGWPEALTDKVEGQ